MNLNEFVPSNITPEEREVLASKEKERIIKEAKMLQEGGQYSIDEKGSFSYEFSENQIKEKENQARENNISKFYEVPDQLFKIDAQIGVEEMKILEEMIRENKRGVTIFGEPADIKNIKMENGEWIITPTEYAIKEASLRMPRTVVPAGELLKQNERSEYPPLVVDYSLTLDQAIAACNFDKVYDIKPSPNQAGYFSWKNNGEKKLIVPELVRLGRYIKWDEAVSEIEKMGLRSATLQELLSFASAHQDDPNWNSSIVAIGEFATVQLMRRVPYFSKGRIDESPESPIERHLGTKITEGAKWNPFSCALCVKIEKGEKN